MIKYMKILSNNDCVKLGKTMTPKGLMIHSTGAPNPNIGRYVPGFKCSGSSHWDRSGITKCVHGFIGKDDNGEVAFCQTMPFAMQGWHAGGSANASMIGVEICEDELDNYDYLKECLQTAAELYATLCITYNLDPYKDVISHHEGYAKGVATNHADIDHWLRKYNLTMDYFRNMVAIEIEKIREEEKKTVKEGTIIMPNDWAAEDWKWCQENGLFKKAYPTSYITRQEMAIVLHRLYNLIKSN